MDPYPRWLQLPWLNNEPLDENAAKKQTHAPELLSVRFRPTCESGSVIVESHPSHTDDYKRSQPCQDGVPAQEM